MMELSIMALNRMFLVVVTVMVMSHRAPVLGQTLYETYLEDGLLNPNGPALVAIGDTFTLNGKELRIFSGAVHYFRVVPQYWRDRLRKMKASGINTVETYVPWNLHEETRGNFDFTGNLDIKTYLQIAQEEDLFVILRPGPYICSEWDFGGLPSWLLRNTNIEVRTMDSDYIAAVDAYFSQLIPIVSDHQFTKGGSIILVQIENEYGGFGAQDFDYLEHLKSTMTNEGIVELYVTSDTPTSAGTKGALPDVLMAANFQHNAQQELSALRALQPNRPQLVMEYWTGWFDHWGENHHTLSLNDLDSTVTEILNEGASINFYMFHGGTSFGFLNGANGDSYSADISSYDYDAPLSEAGDYTPKYDRIKEILSSFSQGKPWNVQLPDPPAILPKAAYGDIQMTEFVALDSFLPLVPKLQNIPITPMELLAINSDSGQSFGFVLYRHQVTIGTGQNSITIAGQVRDRAQVFVGGQLVATLDWKTVDNVIPLDTDVTPGSQTLDILVENMGRVNFGQSRHYEFSYQAKGLLDPVTLNGAELNSWDVFPLEFHPNFFAGLGNLTWSPFSADSAPYPGLVRGTFQVSGSPQDTFIDMENWTKGIVFLNGFNLGRYWNIGPQHTLYVPAPLLREGANEILVLELEKGSLSVTSQDVPNLG